MTMEVLHLAQRRFMDGKKFFALGFGSRTENTIPTIFLGICEIHQSLILLIMIDFSFCFIPRILDDDIYVDRPPFLEALLTR